MTELCNVLIVDDSRSIRMLLNRLVRSSEYKIDCVFEASNGEEALIVLDNNPINLVFTDLNMPGMDGITLILKIRERSSVPIVVISTESGQQTVMEAIKSGANNFIRKPFIPEKVSQVVSRYLNH